MRVDNMLRIIWYSISLGRTKIKLNSNVDSILLHGAEKRKEDTQWIKTFINKCLMADC